MDTLLQAGDHCVDGRGIPVAIFDAQEMIQRVLIRLGVKRGSFGLDRALGSELHKLRRVGGAVMDRVALSYVQEALGDMPDVMVQSVSCSVHEGGVLTVEVGISHSGREYQLEVEVN